MDTAHENANVLPAGLTVGVVDEQRAFPLLIERASSGAGACSLNELWDNYREYLDASLYRTGAILFRGFGVSEQTTFASLIAHLKEEMMNYVDGNSPRTKLGSNIYTSTEYPPEFFISLHNELSYAPRWPERLLFCCVEAASEGGETPLVDGRALLAELPAEVVEEFRRRGVKYLRNLHGGKGFGPSWQKTFETDDPAAVESYADNCGMNLQWMEDGSVRLTCVRPATTFHPKTGEEVWFNQADQYHPSTHPPAVYQAMKAFFKGREEKLPQNATFGDDTPIPLEYLEVIREQTRRLLVKFRWQQGDLLLVDNVLTAHGRMPFKGTRKILVAMTAQTAQRDCAKEIA
ncbi:MAG TPA: TauD/TfdA family dioxygenase [Pyrinomonadaceae bacterium]|nr:TauD/TfdA family dioxygenase [Pyrinomonadaceae bacterium]